MVKRMRRGNAVALLAGLVMLAAAVPGTAAASDWLPHPADATWTYVWSDSVYATVPTKEKVTVKEQKGPAFTLAWTTDGEDNPPDALTTAGTVSFQETNGGLANTDWSSTPPPPSFPILCGSASGCGNSLASAYYNLIWGSRAPVLAEPLLAGTSWTGSGGAQGDVSGVSDYVGTELVSVPAFPQPVPAAKVRTEITQAGALGDPYGSGVRTTWWVYGVGPVKVLFEHTGGVGAPVTTVELASTNQTPKPPPGDADYFPLRQGVGGTYRWTNSRHLAKPVVEKITVAAVASGSAQLTVKSVSGPLKVAGAYGYTRRLDGVTNIWGTTKAASLAKLPPLGPKALAPAKRRHFFTPLDLMDFGLNPIMPAYPKAGDTWTAKAGGRDYEVYGVTGTTTVLGLRKVKVPAGTFTALAVRSVLVQRGFPFGSGTRTSWFAPGRGLVKLVFRHGDGSISRVDLLK
jgi:hypothetical protein